MIGSEEITSAVQTLLSGQLSMGEKVRQFEATWAERVGRRYAVCVNSGSSAVLLMAAALRAPNPKGEPRLEVILPATNWSTSVFPWIQLGFRVVFADIDDYFCLDPASVASALSNETGVIVAVPLLGNAFDPALLTLTDAYHATLVTDACEGHGARIGDRDVGSFGRMAAWSFFMSHHTQTGEGGIIGVDDQYLADTLRSLRAHGWIRERSDRDHIARLYPEIDPRFLFLDLGYNVRPTEITAALGLPQISKLSYYVDHRRIIADAWATGLEEWKEWFELPADRPGTRSSYFGFSLVVRPEAPFSRKDLTDFLNSRGIDTRPIMAGDIRKHPVFRRYQINYRSVPTPRTDLIYERGFFIGCHTGIGETEIQYFLDVMHEFARRH